MPTALGVRMGDLINGLKPVATRCDEPMALFTVYSVTIIVVQHDADKWQNYWPGTYR